MIQSSTNTKENDFNELLYVTFVHDNTGLFKFEYRIVYLPGSDHRTASSSGVEHKGRFGQKGHSEGLGKNSMSKNCSNGSYFKNLLMDSPCLLQEAAPPQLHRGTGCNPWAHQNNYNQTLGSLGIVIITKTTIS